MGRYGRTRKQRSAAHICQRKCTGEAKSLVGLGLGYGEGLGG